MENKDKELKSLIKEYQDGDVEGLIDWIVHAKTVDIFEWYRIRDLLVEEMVFNIPAGSSYQKGSIKYLKQAMQKVSEEEGSLSFSNKLAYKLLADDPTEVGDFIKYYKVRTEERYSNCLSHDLLKMLPGKPWNFWESFYNNFIDGIIHEDFSDREIYNIIKNVNTIFDLDLSQHKAISNAIEYAKYPQGQAMTQALIYSNDFDSFNRPRHDLSSFGRNDERSEFIKKVLVMFNKVELENELDNSIVQKKTSPRNKI